MTTKSKLLSVIIGDYYRKYLSGLVLGAGIELLAKLHDVDTLGTQSGTNWREGLAAPPFDLQFDLSSNFFSHDKSKFLLMIRLKR